MWESILGQTVAALVTVVGAAIAWYLRKLERQLAENTTLTDIEREAGQSLLEGMSVAQDSIVRKAKELTVDGRLSLEDMQAARDCAISHAVKIANGPAKELLLTWSNDRLNSIIRQLLSKYRSVK